jgi:hypothetical protein
VLTGLATDKFLAHCLPDDLVEEHACSFLLCANRAVCVPVACCCAQSQLAALVSKCKGPEDLDYFLLEAAALVGLNTPPEAGAKVRCAVGKGSSWVLCFPERQLDELLHRKSTAVMSLC